MLSIEAIREQYPEGTKDLSDAEIIFRVSKSTGLDAVQVAKDFGIEDPENAPRGFLGAANDTAINFGNAVAGGVGAVADFVAPGNRFSKAVDEFVEDGVSKLSLQERLSQDRFSQALDTDDLGTQAAGVWDRVTDAPIQTAAQALGNFVVPGASIKGAQLGARALGVGTKYADDAIDAARNAGPITPRMGIDIGTKAADKAIERVGLGTGMLLSGAMNAGDAAGTAYDLVLESTGSEELALKAAREASIAPFAVGLATGAFGAEKVLARTGKQPLGSGASILATGGIEAGTEFIEEGTAAYSGRKVASLYDDSINPMTGVFGQSLMGAVQGGATGASVALLDKMGRGAENAAISRAINNSSLGQDPDTGEFTLPGSETPVEMAARIKQEQDAQLAQQQAEKEAATKLAAANQQNNQAQQQQAQVEQQAQTTQQLYDQFGVQPVLDPQTNQPVGKFVLGDKIFFTEGDAMAFAEGLTEAGKDLSPAQQSLVGKLFAGGVVPVKATDTAKGLISKASKFMQDTQLASATDMNDVVSRIDQTIEAIAPKTDLVGSKMSKDAEMLTSLDKLRKSITGEASTRLGEIADQQTMSLQQQEAQKAAKAAKGGKKNPATTATTPGNAQTSGGPNGQQQSAPGMGEVSEQGSAGGTVSPANGDVGSSQVQPVGSGSVADGSDGQQNDAGRGTGNEQRTVQPTADGAPATGSTQDGGQEVNPVYARYSSLTPAQQKRVSDITRISQADMQSPGVVAVNERQLTAAMDKVAPDTKGATNAGQEASQGNSEVSRTPTVGEGKSTETGESQTTRGYGQRDDSNIGKTDTGRGAGKEGQTEQDLADEGDTETPSLFRKILEYVFIETGGNKGKATAQRKVEYIDTYYGVAAKVRDESAQVFAQKYNLKTGTVVGWRKLISDMPDGRDRFFVEYGDKMQAAAKIIAEREGISLTEMLETFKGRAKAAAEERAEYEKQYVDDSNQAPVQDEDGAVELDTNDRAGLDTIVSRDKTASNEAYADEVTNDGEDGGEQSGSVIKSPGANSVSEFGNKGEGIARRWERLSKKVEELEVALDEAQMEGDDAKVEELQAQLTEAKSMEQKLFADAEAEQRKSNRKNTRADTAESTTKETDSKPRKKAEPKVDKDPAPKKIETTKEAAGQQWDKVADTMDGAPKWEDLTKSQQNTFYEFGPDNWTENDVVQELAKIARSRNSTTKQPKGQGYKATELRKEVVDFIGVDNADRLVIYQSAKDIPKHILKANPDAATAQGFVYGNRAYLIADNIKLGRGKAVFLHEVGSHLGLDEILKDEFGELVNQIYAWAKADDGSLESQIAKRAQARVRNAKSPVDQIESEMIAYFIEEAVLAGVEPSAKSSTGKFLETIIEKFKQALSLLGINPHFLSAQDVVDMAFGAARMSMADQSTNSSDQSAQVMKFSKAADKITPAQERRIDRNLQRIPKRGRTFWNAFTKAAARVGNHFRFTTHMLEQAAKTMSGAKDLLRLIRGQNAMRSAELYRVERITKEFDKLKKPMQDAVNRMLKASTTSGKWAFTPAWVDKPKVDAGLEAEFAKLTPEAQKVVMDVFAHGYTTMMQMRQSVSEIMASQYDERIAQAQKAGNTKLADSLKTERDTALGDYAKLFEISATKPYSPLRRYGKHVVTYRSAEMQDAMDVLDAAREGEDIPEEDLKAVRKFVRENEGDPEHYQVYFREGAIEAERLAEDLREQYGDGVQQFTRDEDAAGMYMSPDVHGVLYRLRKKANDSADEVGSSEATRDALNKVLSELHLSLLSEQSARHAEHKRAEGTVTGADDNMMRAFHSHGLATSSLLASLHNGEKVQKAFETFEKQAQNRRNPNREQSESLYNEVAARYAMGLDSGNTPITDKVLRYNSAWMLLSRPLYYLQNAMQPWMMSAPYMAGKFGAQAYSEMLSVYNELSGVLLANRVTQDMLNKLPADARRVVFEMLDKGTLSISLDQDMGDRLRGTNVVDNTITKLQGVAERVEGINRVVTAVSAYRLSRKNNVGHAKAVEYADEVVYQTHGDYSGFNAPRIMRNQVGRIITQFRKFQLIQIGVMAKLVRESFGNASADEKAVARRALRYTLGTTFMMGGMTALPGFAAVAWVIGKAFGEDDEPNDPEAQMARLRRMIGDPDVANLLTEGVSKAAFGFDGEPIFGGMGNMLSLIPYTKVEGTDRSTYSNIVLGLSGAAVGGLGPKMFDGMGRMAEGDVAGGLQRVLPTGVGNVIKAMELQDKGLTRKAGTEILSPDDVSAFTSFMQAIGLRTNELADKEFINRVTNTYDAYYREQSQKIKRQYSEAFEKGDSRKMAEARELWSEMNDSRRRNGFDVQPYSSLIKAPRQARKYEQRVNRQLDNTGRDLAGMR
jgi:hypothetical protein